jgi:hypothetical protein
MIGSGLSILGIAMCATRSAIAAICLFAFSGAAAAEPVDLELVLLADASGSIDNNEIRFQRQGYAEALAHEDVLDAIADGLHQRIAVTYVEWAGPASQHVVVPWTVIAGRSDAEGFGTKLMEAPRKARGRNAIGSALTAAELLITGNTYEGLRKVIDLSADSVNSWDPIPIDVARKSALDQGITINGLAVLCRLCSGRPVSYDLEQAFADTIIGGERSFVVTADEPGQFQIAVRRKLILEIANKPSVTAAARLRVSNLAAD